ncbi:MAG: hypothetical protein U0234_30160 [Sandaracinus sp.]
MQLFASAALLCASLLVAEALRAAAPIPSALGLVALAVVTSVVTTRPSLHAVLAGAGAALGYALVRPSSAAAAGAAWTALVIGPRVVRSFTRAGAMLAASAALLAGALGGTVLAASTHAGPERLVGSLLFVAFLVGLPLLVPADDPLTGRLRATAARSRGAARVALLRAVAVRRRLTTSLHRPTRSERRALDAAFDRLGELGDARRRTLAGAEALERAMRERLDVLVGCVRALDRRAATHERLDAGGDARLELRRVDVEHELRALDDLDRGA